MATIPGKKVEILPTFQQKSTKNGVKLRDKCQIIAQPSSSIPRTAFTLARKPCHALPLTDKHCNAKRPVALAHTAELMRRVIAESSSATELLGFDRLVERCRALQ